MQKDHLYGVMLMAFGGPDSPEAIEPFLINLMGGRKPTPQVIEKVRERYKIIGGKSPLLEITRRQARALEERLRKEGAEITVKVGMRYWHPFIPDTLASMAAAGVKKVLAISLSPHYSRVSTGAYAAEIARYATTENSPGVHMADPWYDHPFFIEALSEKVKEGLNCFPEEQRSGVEVVFSAHSLPMSHIEEGDPYVAQVEATVDALLERIGPVSWHLAYQSRGGGAGQWLEPEVGEILNGIAARGQRNVLLVPIGFVADHIETLFDIDIAYRQQAKDLDLNFVRAGALNDGPAFIEALARIVITELSELVQQS
ncbi:MAG: ferrochelatase [Bacillota bacterium]